MSPEMLPPSDAPARGIVARAAARWRRETGLGGATALLLLFALFHAKGVSELSEALEPRSLREDLGRYVRRLREGETQQRDSWYPMTEAWWEVGRGGADRLYATIFFDRGIKFQYPPSALALVAALEPLGPRAEATFYAAMRWATWAALVATAAAAARARWGGATPGRGRGAVEPALQVALLALLALYYYPLLKAFTLGQVQPLVAAATAAALAAWLWGAEATAGVLVGATCWLKPQGALLLVWALARRRWRFAAAMAATAGAGAVASVAWFGWPCHADYLRVLGFIARHGESYHPNQSINGLLHRLLDNGNNLAWVGDAFPPYHPVVAWGTTLSSLLLVGAALWPPRGRGARGSAGDFALAVMAATLAAPVAWEHHYSTLLPVFALVAGSWFRAAAGEGDAPPPRAAAWWTLALAYLLAAHVVNATQLLADDGPWNVLQSYRLAGGLMLFAIVWAGRAHLGPAAAPPPGPPAGEPAP